MNKGGQYSVTAQWFKERHNNGKKFLVPLGGISIKNDNRIKQA